MRRRTRKAKCPLQNRLKLAGYCIIIEHSGRMLLILTCGAYSGTVRLRMPLMAPERVPTLVLDILGN